MLQLTSVTDPFEVKIPFYKTLKTQGIYDVFQEYGKWTLVCSHQLVLGDLFWINNKGFEYAVQEPETF